MDAEGQGGNNVHTQEGTPGVDPGSEQTVEEIAQEIDSIPVYEQANDTPNELIDAPNMAVGTGVEGNVSRPENYADENAPKDLGLGEDEQAPDVTQLMQEGLDNHSQNINREKVIGLVSEALQGFKACKPIIEKSKLQAPQLYESSIAMLRAMIEMCKMLGLDQEAQTGDGSDPLGNGSESNGVDGGTPAGGAASGAGAGELESAPQQNDPSSGIPNYAPKDSSSSNGGPAEKKSEGAVGQSIGKLPTKATTEHVARTPQLPNAINEKGQKKVIDPVTGKVRWIDMKEGKVQSPTGVPVKPGTVEAEGQEQPERPDGPKVRN